MIVERVADQASQTYVQAMKTKGGYLIEKRDRSADSHAHAFTVDMRQAHAAMTTWAFGLNRTDDLPWKPGMAE